MTGYLILIALCVLGANAIPKPVGRVGGSPNPVVALFAPHACMILVHRTNLNGTNTAALGSGSIISARHVLTAAHLVQGDVDRYQIGFIVGGTSRRLVDSSFRLIHENYDNSDFSNDIALLFLQGTATFPLINAITISTDEAAPGAGPLFTVGFGFTAANSTGASSEPHQANEEPIECDLGDVVAADTHFCAIDAGGISWVCPGDNGAGSFTGDETDAANNILVGVASRILPGCAASQQTGYTIVGKYVSWITNVTGIPVPTFIANYNKLHKLS
ncbi:chymotrypsin-1-like [Bradysia coprophila]|uniref:chymotrypsin-1-like n=1 Tax=Bradysia coprophila TaxID=38358 RepID=UPI00187D77ED|nr:chymotrypsin-1-like [Bradysia coprophila]